MRRIVLFPALAGMFVLGVLSARLVPVVHAADANAQARIVNILKMTDEELGAERPGTHIRSKTFFADPGSTFSVQTGDVAKHYHQDSDEIQYILEGRGTFWLGDHQQEVGPGDLIHHSQGHGARRFACDQRALQGHLRQVAAAGCRRRAPCELRPRTGLRAGRPTHTTLLDANELLDLLQWPAMVVTLVAAWLVASKRRRRRHAGFWLFVLSNALWIGWGWHAHSYALILLQAGLFVMNVRGMRENPE